MRRMNRQCTVIEFQASIDDRLGVARFLFEAADLLRVTPVHLDMALFPSPDNAYPIGFTAEVKFQESFVNLDTWPEDGYACVTAISCKQFSDNDLLALIERSWAVNNVTLYPVFSRASVEGA